MKLQGVSFTPKAWSDIELYLQTNQTNILKKINELVKAILRDPYKGIGKPEPLKHNFSGYYSRRITDEHRLIYEIRDNYLFIISCRLHYE